MDGEGALEFAPLTLWWVSALGPVARYWQMGKDKFEPRISFSHGRTKPVVVENVKRRIAAPTALICPSCGAKMKLARSGGSPKLTASCPNCTE